MIIPYLFGFASFRKAPMTWILCFINCLVFVATLQNQLTSQKKISKIMDDDVFMATQAHTFAQFIIKNSDDYSDLMRDLAKGTLAGSKKKTRFLGSLALRDFRFLKEAAKSPWEGDQVALKKWRTQTRDLASARRESASNQFGLSQATLTLSNFFTYQFLHGDFFHLGSNMFFLLIFGTAVESVVGALGVLLIFLFGGAGAAVVFTQVSGLSALPLIGASGSVSAMMGVFAAFYRSKPVRFFFWIMPIKNYFGFVYLPAWCAVAMWVCMDFAGLVGTLPEMGGTAHAAHLGGVFFGFLLGYTAYRWNQKVFTTQPS